MAGFDGGDAERHQDMAFSGAGGPDQGGVLRGPDPFQAGEVVEGWLRDRRACDVELVEGLDHGEGGLPHAGAGVGFVAGGDLGFDQGAQELLGVPALRLGGDQQFWGEAAHRGHLQPFQPVVEVRGQWRRGGAHDGSAPFVPMA